MNHMKIYGPQISTFVRIVAMTATEKELSWEIVPTDPHTPEHRARHPFERAPAVEIGGVQLVESEAICRYIDEVCGPPPLQPSDPLERAEMTKWMSFVCQYIFPAVETGLVLPRIVAPMMGRQPDEERIRQALPTIQYQLEVTERALMGQGFVAGKMMTLADIFLFCCWESASFTPEGKQLLAAAPATSNWMRFMQSRPGAQKTDWGRLREEE